jgi:hypothetical protein
MAAQAETKMNMFHSLDRDMALQSEERFRGAETLSRNDVDSDKWAPCDLIACSNSSAV